jgi:hypothetical protein
LGIDHQVKKSKTRRMFLRYVCAGILGAAVGYGARDLAEYAGLIKPLTKTITQTLTRTESETQTVTERITETITKSAKEPFDIYLAEIWKSYPELSEELQKLPDFSVVDEKDLEALIKITDLAADPKNRPALGDILNEGIKEKRKYCSPLEALLWILYDKKPDDPTLKRIISEPTKLTEYSWKNSSESNNYKSDRWKDFDEVVYRLNSPDLVSIYMKDNIRWEPEKTNEYLPAKMIFERKYDDCDGHAILQSYLLKTNGYDAWVVGLSIESELGHNVCGYYINKLIYILDNEGLHRGPFNSWYEVGDFYSNIGWAEPHCSIRLLDPFVIKKPVTDYTIPNVMGLPWIRIR